MTSDSDNINNYYNSSSVASSTTGNYYGIYDMSGGAWEYVMGVMEAQNGRPVSGRNNNYNSGFNGPYSYCKENGNQNGDTCGEETENISALELPSNKYYDLYDYSTSNQEYQRGHLGDGTKEFGPFYSVGWPKNDGTYNARNVGNYNADLAVFVAFYGPWFKRGGSKHDGSDAGVSAIDIDHGYASNTFSFRIVLTP